MHLLLTGSVATDHLMTFQGKFVDSIDAANLGRLSISFLTEDLVVHRGGTAGNIATGIGLLGVPAQLLAAVGPDFDSTGYRAHLDGLGVDTSGLRVSETRQTARFTCTTDEAQCQIGAFYAGAMVEAREIDLPALPEDSLVVISPDDVPAMVLHTRQARDAGIPFMADVSQQINFLSDRDEIRSLVDGAAYVVTNDYERELLEKKAEWTADEVLDHVGWRITTLGAEGVLAERKGQAPIRVAAVPERVKADPTGVGDALRAGMLSALAWGLGLERALQVGSVVATLALEVVGPQEYDVSELDDRFAQAFGAEALAEVVAARTA